MWVPERDACDDCYKCRYFLDEYWNCQGEKEPCYEFVLSIEERIKEQKIACEDCNGK